MINLPIVQTALNGENLPTINARDLFSALEITTRLNDWVQRRIENYGFIEGVDFYSTLSKNHKNGAFSLGRPKTEYFLTLDMAKHIALMENNTKGREIRNSLIEAERQLREEVPALVRSLQQEKEALQIRVGAQQECIELKDHLLVDQQALKAALNNNKDLERKYITLLEDTLADIKKEKTQTQARTLASGAASKCKPGLKLTKDEKRTIVGLKQEGMRICDIARQLSRSTSSVDTVLRAYRENGGQC